LFFPCWKFQFFEAREIQDTDFICAYWYWICICFVFVPKIASRTPAQAFMERNWCRVMCRFHSPSDPLLKSPFIIFMPCVRFGGMCHPLMPWLLKHQFLNHPFPCRHCSPRMTPLNTQFQKVIYILTIPRFRLGSSYFDQTFTIGDPELDDAKICRNPLYFMVKTMGFQLTSHQNLSIETLIHRFTYDIFYN
jgi:hypothetical protein